MLDPRLTAELAPLARDLLAQVAPADPFERMLAAQLIATFNRSMFLARHANTQKDAKWFSLYSRECDRATTLCRRQMQMLIDYRRPQPPRPPRRTTFTSIRHANIAGQQVITTAPLANPYRPSPPTTAIKEPDAEPLHQAQAALPPLRRRPGRPPKVRPPEPPMAPEPRSDQL